VEGGRGSRLQRPDSEPSSSALGGSTEASWGLLPHRTNQENLVPTSSWPSGTGTGLGIGDNDSEIELHLLREGRTGAGEDVIRLEPWVNQVTLEKYFANALSDQPLQTPLTVGPQRPLEIVVQLFKRLGYVTVFRTSTITTSNEETSLKDLVSSW